MWSEYNSMKIEILGRRIIFCSVSWCHFPQVHSRSTFLLQVFVSGGDFPFEVPCNICQSLQAPTYRQDISGRGGNRTCDICRIGAVLYHWTIRPLKWTSTKFTYHLCKIYLQSDPWKVTVNVKKAMTKK